MHMANRFGSLSRGQSSARGGSCSPVRAVLVGLSLMPGSAPARAGKRPRASSAAGGRSVLQVRDGGQRLFKVSVQLSALQLWPKSLSFTRKAHSRSQRYTCSLVVLKLFLLSRSERFSQRIFRSIGRPLGSVPRTDPKGTAWEYSEEQRKISIFQLLLTKSYWVLYKDDYENDQFDFCSNRKLTSTLFSTEQRGNKSTIDFQTCQGNKSTTALRKPNNVAIARDKSKL